MLSWLPVLGQIDLNSTDSTYFVECAKNNPTGPRCLTQMQWVQSDQCSISLAAPDRLHDATLVDPLVEATSGPSDIIATQEQEATSSPSPEPQQQQQQPQQTQQQAQASPVAASPPPPEQQQEQLID